MNDSELDQLLKFAAPPAPPHAGFQRDVWLRIEAAEAHPRPSRLARRFFACLALPSVAFATCSVMVAVGVWIGLESGNSTPQGQGEMAYIQAVSPFARTHR